MEVTKLNNYNPTNAEVKILDVLSDPDNLRKNITEKSKLAGVSRKTWYASFAKSGFVSLIPNTSIEMIRARAIELTNAAIKAGLGNSFADRKMLLETAGVISERPTNPTVIVIPIYGGKSIEGTGDVTQDNDRVRAVTITSKPLNQSSDTTASIDVKDSTDSTQENE